MLCSGLPPRIYESLKILCCLASVSDPLQAHEIASATGLPPAQTAKMLQLMTWAGFVGSRRGTKGGYWLVKPANRIRVTDVADFFAHHTPEKSPRKRDELLIALERATARCHKEFERITVADLAKTSKCEETRDLSVAGVVSAEQRRKAKQRNGGVRRRTIATLVAVLLIVFAQAGSLACARPECALTHSASTMHCSGMGMEMETATSSTMLISAGPLPCCKLKQAPTDRGPRSFALKSPTVSLVRSIPRVFSVSLTMPRTMPVYRVESSPPRLTSLLCTLLI